MPRAQQLSLSELDPDATHERGGYVYTLDGWRQSCSCGWVSDPLPTKRRAHLAVSAHMARTVQGTLVMHTLRK
jgi:hypothetical protein